MFFDKGSIVYAWDDKMKTLIKGILKKVKGNAWGDKFYYIENCADGEMIELKDTKYNFIWDNIEEPYKQLKKELKKNIKIAEYDLADNTCALESLEKFYKENKEN